MRDCGGCKGLGKHSPGCPTQPGAKWYRLAQQAESIGDQIGPNDMRLSSKAWALSAELETKWKEEVCSHA